MNKTGIRPGTITKLVYNCGFEFRPTCQMRPKSEFVSNYFSKRTHLTIVCNWVQEILYQDGSKLLLTQLDIEWSNGLGIWTVIGRVKLWLLIQCTCLDRTCSSSHKDLILFYHTFPCTRHPSCYAMIKWIKFVSLLLQWEGCLGNREKPTRHVYFQN